MALAALDASPGRGLLRLTRQRLTRPSQRPPFAPFVLCARAAALAPDPVCFTSDGKGSKGRSPPCFAREGARPGRDRRGVVQAPTPTANSRPRAHSPPRSRSHATAAAIDWKTSASLRLGAGATDPNGAACRARWRAARSSALGPRGRYSLIRGLGGARMGGRTSLTRAARRESRPRAPSPRADVRPGASRAARRPGSPARCAPRARRAHAARTGVARAPSGRAEARA